MSKLVWYANVPYLIMLIISGQIRKMCDQRKNWKDMCPVKRENNIISSTELYSNNIITCDNHLETTLVTQMITLPQVFQNIAMWFIDVSQIFFISLEFQD